MSKFDTIMNCSKLTDKMNMRIYGYDKDDSSLLGKDVFLYNRASPCNWSGNNTFLMIFNVVFFFDFVPANFIGH